MCFPPVSFPILFLCSLSLLPLLPASSAPLPSSSGNGRLLGRRSKRRNCLQVQSSKKASSIWRDWVRWARRLLPGPPAAAAATTAPASCSGDPELGFAVSAPAALTRSRTSYPPWPHKPFFLLGPQLLGPGLLCCSDCGHSPVACVPVCHHAVRVCRCSPGPCGPLRTTTRDPEPRSPLPRIWLQER